MVNTIWLVDGSLLVILVVIDCSLMVIIITRKYEAVDDRSGLVEQLVIQKHRLLQLAF